MDHTPPPERLAAAGRDVEAQVLARLDPERGHHQLGIYLNYGDVCEAIWTCGLASRDDILLPQAVVLLLTVDS